MSRFRFYYKRMSYRRWLIRTARRRVLQLGLPLPAAIRSTRGMTAWRRSIPVFAHSVSVAVVLRIGGFVIGEAGDPQLSGHPGIRY